MSRIGKNLGFIISDRDHDILVHNNRVVETAYFSPKCCFSGDKLPDDKELKKLRVRFNAAYVENRSGKAQIISCPRCGKKYIVALSPGFVSPRQFHKYNILEAPKMTV